MTFPPNEPSTNFTKWHPDLYGPHVPKGIIQFFEDVWDKLWNTGTYLGRIRFVYGDPCSGLSHGEEDVGILGIDFEARPFNFTVRHSRSSKRLHRVLIDRIVKIETSDSYLIYRHPRFHNPGETPAAVSVTATPGRNSRRIVIRKKRL